MDKKLENEIKKSFPKIEKLFDEKSLQEFVNTRESELCKYHFGLGTWIRNFILRNDRVIYKLFVENGFTYKDDISAIIIREFHRCLNKPEK